MCGDPWAPSVLIVLRVQPLGPTPWRAVSSPVWSFADLTWSWGRLRHPRAILLEVPLLSTVISSPSIFTWVPLGSFSGSFNVDLKVIVTASVFPGLFLPLLLGPSGHFPLAVLEKI